MRIPIAESEIGVWYPMKDGYYFVSEITSHYEFFIKWYTDYKCLRRTTFEDFKKELTYRAGYSDSELYRTKGKNGN